MYADDGIFAELSERVIGCSFAVANALGVGFLEKVYENSFSIELRARGIEVDQQVGMTVRYRGASVGQYTADLVVAGTIVVEVKATTAFDPAHFAQCRNYLKATGLQLCLLINFGAPRVAIKRVIMTNPQAR